MISDSGCIEFNGNYYVIDLGGVLDVVKMKSTYDDLGNDVIITKSKKSKKGNDEEERLNALYGEISIDISKWEIINKMIDTLLNSNDEIDSALGYKSIEKLPFGFKLAFNILLKYNILKIID